MRKQVWMLKTDREFSAFSPPLSEEELRALEDSIRREGCKEPLVVWNKTIIDGYKRYDICNEYGIPFAVRNMEFEGRDDAVRWTLLMRLSRPGMKAYERAQVVLGYAPYLRKVPKHRRKVLFRELMPGDMSERGTEEQSDGCGGRLREQLAGLANVSHGTLDKVKYIEENGDEMLKAEARQGFYSIHRAYNIIRKQENAWKMGSLLR